MPSYIYETSPAKKGAKPRRFEIKQSIKDAAFTKHPETGEPIKRVVVQVSPGLMLEVIPHHCTGKNSFGHGDLSPAAEAKIVKALAGLKSKEQKDAEKAGDGK